MVLANLGTGYVETMNWGMISYEIPLSVFPETYNGRPLQFAGLAAQKRHCALYLMCIYQDPDLYNALLAEYSRTHKKPDLGKSCLRFQSADDLPLETIGRMISATPMQSFIDSYQAARKSTGPSHRI